MPQEPVALETVDVEHSILMGQALARLRATDDFKLVIDNGYICAKALASVSMLGVPQVQDRGERPKLMEELVAISNLQFYLRQIELFYASAKAPVMSDDEELELAELPTEGGAN